MFLKIICAFCKKDIKNQKLINVNTQSIPTKNKWLYPKNDLGKMEKGVVY